MTSAAPTANIIKSVVDSIWHYWQAGGWLMVPLLAVAFLILYRALTLLSALQQALATPDSYYDMLAERLSTGQAPGKLLDWLITLPGAGPRLVWHVLLRAEAGLPVRTAFHQCRDAELATHRHAISILAALVIAAPLLGLLGTVLGMISTFNVVAYRHGGTAMLVADGISQALVTTQLGLVAALPGTFALARLRRLLNRLSNDIDRCESHFLGWHSQSAGETAQE